MCLREAPHFSHEERYNGNYKLMLQYFPHIHLYMLGCSSCRLLSHFSSKVQTCWLDQSWSKLLITYRATGKNLMYVIVHLPLSFSSFTLSSPCWLKQCCAPNKRTQLPIYLSIYHLARKVHWDTFSLLPGSSGQDGSKNAILCDFCMSCWG